MQDNLNKCETKELTLEQISEKEQNSEECKRLDSKDPFTGKVGLAAKLR
jgi:hypothetical protein